MRKKESGFTFIELLVSVTIILVISSIAVVSFQSANKRARDDRRKSDLEKTRAALELYRLDNDDYPIGDWPAMMAVLTADDYLNEAPTDPKGYSYYYLSSDGDNYQICAYFEGGGTSSCSGSCGTQACNYRLNNP